MLRLRVLSRRAAAVFVILVGCSGAASPLDETQPQAAATADELAATLDRLATTMLAESGVPSLSVAAVRDGKIIFVRAYGDARTAPPVRVPATPQMRYAIGSVAKQLTAVALLLLAEDGKLTLDDPVGKYVPDLMRGDTITIRQILSHTSGYRDYAPQDYMIPAWLQPGSPAALLAQWAHQPLDFEPGTAYQYSNTNFVIAGMIVEKLAGKSLFDFLQERVFAKLGMTSVVDVDRGTLATTDPAGYFRRANGPPHEVPRQGPGWKLGAYELGMTAEELAKWNIAIIDRAVMSPASYAALEHEVLLANGTGTGYALGIGVGLANQHRKLRHGGEDNGFVAESIVMPEDRIAAVVLTNQDATPVAARLADKIIDALLAANAPHSVASDRHVAQLLADLARGALDRTLLTADANAYFTAEAIEEYRVALVAAGAVQSVVQSATGRRGGMTSRRYAVVCAAKKLDISVYETDDGKLEQFLIE